jgi:hypothetical protein
MIKYRNYPLHDCAKQAEKLAKAGCKVFQKWTCAECGERVTANLPNHWTEQGHHEEKADGSPCGCITDLRLAGCNYMVTGDTPKAQAAIFSRMD